MKLDSLTLEELTAGRKASANVATLYSQLLQRVLDRGLDATAWAKGFGPKWIDTNPLR